MSNSFSSSVSIKIDVPIDLLAKVKKVATEKNISVEDALIFLLRVDAHRK